MKASGPGSSGMWVEVRFNGKKAMQVLASYEMRNNMCGLCGNYNGDPGDDAIGGDTCLAPGLVPSQKVKAVLG